MSTLADSSLVRNILYKIAASWGILYINSLIYGSSERWRILKNVTVTTLSDIGPPLPRLALDWIINVQFTATG
jgi:hypothetical protein